jgi:hypothetical protein
MSVLIAIMVRAWHSGMLFPIFLSWNIGAIPAKRNEWGSIPIDV